MPQVLDFTRVKQIPPKHIMKRWTRDARDVLPSHLTQYQKDQMYKLPFTYRNFNMYMNAMELVRLGDASVDAYDKLMSLFKANMQEMLPFAEVHDGLGSEDRVPDNGIVVDQLEIGEGVEQGLIQAQQAEFGGCDNISASGSINRLVGLSDPAKRNKVGRTHPPYDGLSKQTRLCTICRKQGHKRTTCPDRGDTPKQPRRPGRCKNCGVEGHRRNNCTKPLEMRMPDLYISCYDELVVDGYSWDLFPGQTECKL